MNSRQDTAKLSADLNIQYVPRHPSAPASTRMTLPIGLNTLTTMLLAQCLVRHFLISNRESTTANLRILHDGHMRPLDNIDAWTLARFEKWWYGQASRTCRAYRKAHLPCDLYWIPICSLGYDPVISRLCMIVPIRPAFLCHFWKTRRTMSVEAHLKMTLTHTSVERIQSLHKSLVTDSRMMNHTSLGLCDDTGILVMSLCNMNMLLGLLLTISMELCFHPDKWNCQMDNFQVRQTCIFPLLTHF